MTRLFIGLFLPQAIVLELAQICYGLEGARWQPEEKLHITLEFLGDVEGQLENDVSDILRRIESPNFSLQIKGLGHFPLRKQPSVLWAGVGLTEELERFRNKIHGSLRKLPGLKLENRKYHPHVTLARISEVRDQYLANYYESHPLFRTSEFSINRFDLVKSTLHSSGSKYELVESFPLLGSAD